MGFIQGCNICKTQGDIGEIDTGNNQNNIRAKTLFEDKIKKNKEATILTNNNINRLMSQYIISANNIDVPTEIFETKPVNGFQTDLIKFKNGDTYQGYFSENNKKDGYGVYIKKNGYIYKGLWNNDQIGDYGLFIDPKGNYYKGNLVSGEANGEGEILINNKIKYVGHFDNNLPNKKGQIINLSDNSIYEGELINGKKEGKGILKFTDGTEYEGEFINDKYEGFGKLKFKNGCIYA